uniref:Uncharacterized protein n=1 Tax=Anguilla anguilla TaxID=7936 RepID=A0A0E9TBI3_ANGAN
MAVNAVGIFDWKQCVTQQLFRAELTRDQFQYLKLTCLSIKFHDFVHVLQSADAIWL